MDDNDASITVRCGKDFKRRLAAYAKSQDLTISQLVRQHFRSLPRPATIRKSKPQRTAA